MGDLFIIRRYRHYEFEILQSSSLGHLPMDTGRCERLVVLISTQWHLRHVEYKVTNMAENLVLVDIPSEGLGEFV